MTVAEGLGKRGENRTEEGSMSKGNKIGRRSTANGSIGMGRGWGRRGVTDVKFPQFCGRCLGTLENDTILVLDGDSRGREGNVTASIAELANAEKGLGGKIRNNMTMAGGQRKARDVEVSFMGGMENCPGRGVDSDRSIVGTFVAYRHGWGEEVGGAPRIGDGIEWSGGRAGDGGRQ